MKVKLTNADLGSAFIPDVGEFKPVQTRQGVTLQYDVEKELADDAATLASVQAGGLKKLIDAGDLTVTEETAAITAMHSHSETATASQTTVTLAAGYVTGNKSLHVYVDGALQPKPDSAASTYAETSATVVTFDSALTGGEDLQFIWSK